MNTVPPRLGPQRAGVRSNPESKSESLPNKDSPFGHVITGVIALQLAVARFPKDWKPVFGIIIKLRNDITHAINRDEGNRFNQRGARAIEKQHIHNVRAEFGAFGQLKDERDGRLRKEQVEENLHFREAWRTAFKLDERKRDYFTLCAIMGGMSVWMYDKEKASLYRKTDAAKTDVAKDGGAVPSTAEDSDLLRKLIPIEVFDPTDRKYTRLTEVRQSTYVPSK